MEPGAKGIPGDGDIGCREEVFHVGVDQHDRTVVVGLQAQRRPVGARGLVRREEAEDPPEVVVSAHRDDEGEGRRVPWIGRRHELFTIRKRLERTRDREQG